MAIDSTTMTMINRTFEIMKDDKATLPFWEFLQYLFQKVEILQTINENNGDIMGELVVAVNGVRPTTTANVVLYTAPALGSGTKLFKLISTNTLGSVETFNLYILPDGAAVTPVYQILSSADATGNGSIVANGTNEITECEGILIPPGGSLIAATTNANSISFRGNGIEY